jgi:hypothetical protein
MRGYIPSGQPTQLVGLPPLSEETYRRLGEAMRELYESYLTSKPECPRSDSLYPCEYPKVPNHVSTHNAQTSDLASVFPEGETTMNYELEAITKRVEADRLHFATGNSIQLDDSKDREYLLSLVRAQQSALDGVRKLTEAAFAGNLYVLPGGYPSRPVEAFELRQALDAL